jgi:hypothetical protein
MLCLSFARSVECFKKFYNKLRASIRGSVSGCFGEYGFKRLLDVIVVGAAVDRKHVADWPGNCPGYKTGLHKVFDSSLAVKQYTDALFTLHSYREDAQNLCVGETSMMLCWWSSSNCNKRMLAEL